MSQSIIKKSYLQPSPEKQQDERLRPQTAGSLPMQHYWSSNLPVFYGRSIFSDTAHDRITPLHEYFANIPTFHK
jgi:hypothetical protein